jgi:hypothetical protein
MIPRRVSGFWVVVALDLFGVLAIACVLGGWGR